MRTTLRGSLMTASKFVPEWILRVIDRVRTRWFLWRVRGPTAEYVRRNGLEVRRGPFAGVRYPNDLRTAPGDLVAKLVGTYERELHGVFADWVAAGHSCVIDVGCAEGFYAVGFAASMPKTTVYAFDIDAAARAQCAALARLNGVDRQVHVLGACEPSSLGDYPEQGVALLSDCEGYERTLLDPALAPRLRSWPILVELHEFLDESITDTIRKRFAESHEIEIIEGENRESDGHPELEFMTRRQRGAVLGERRPGRMRWAYLRPR
jgi:hypothetical protein